MAAISVVIPLYNKEEYIERAIRSVLTQSFSGFELIVVDDGSADRSFAVVENIKDRRIRLINQNNSGESAARNRGIAEAKTGIIAFLDADDEWKPFFLKTILKLRKSYPGAGAYATAYEVNEEGRVFPGYNNKVILSEADEGIIENYFKTAFYCSPVCSSAVAIPKAIFNELGGFPVGEILGGDLDMWLRIALRYPIAISKRICAVYHKDAAKRVDVDNIFPLEYKLVESGSNALLNTKLDAETTLYLKKYINKFQLKSAGHCLRFGQRKKAKAILLQCHPATIAFLKRKIWWFIWTLLPFTFFRMCLETKIRLVGALRKLRGKMHLSEKNAFGKERLTVSMDKRGIHGA